MTVSGEELTWSRVQYISAVACLPVIPPSGVMDEFRHSHEPTVGEVRGVVCGARKKEFINVDRRFLLMN